jgi:hypothetical protein
VGFSKVLNFSTSAACPENVYVHDNSNPILKNLLPVTVANILPPLLRKFAEEKGKHAAAKFFNVDRKRVCLPGQLLLISDV